MPNREELDDGDEVGTQMLSKKVLTNAMMPSTQEMVEMNSTKYRPSATATMRNLLKNGETFEENNELMKKSQKSFKTDSKHRRIGSQMY